MVVEKDGLYMITFTAASVPEEMVVWIGLNSIRDPKRFTWESGSSTAYDGFADGEPNHNQGDEEHAVHLRYPWGSQTWNDQHVNDNLTYLCESCNPDPPCIHGTLQHRSMPNECQQTPTKYLSCPLGYAFHPEHVTYHKAMANCHSKHDGILATITGAQHQASIVKGSSCFRLPKNCLTEANVPRNASYWIGLHSLQNATRFTWLSGSNTAYSNFYAGQPDNHGNVSAATCFSSRLTPDKHSFPERTCDSSHGRQPPRGRRMERSQGVLDIRVRVRILHQLVKLEAQTLTSSC